MPKFNSLNKTLAVLSILFALGACAMFSGRETAGQYVDDTTITSKVKTEILNDPSLKVLQVNVETMQGVVQLSGFVDSPQKAAKAVYLARHVEGVRSVKNDIVVR